MPWPVMLKKLNLNCSKNTTRPSRTNTQKRRPFHYKGLECKSRKSRNTLGNRQICPWSTKWCRAKAKRVLPRECTGHSKHPLSTTQENTLQWTPPDGQHWNQTDYILCRRRSSYSQQKQDRELTVAPITNSLLPNSDLNWRVGKITRPFRYDLNQIPYDYTLKVRNKFKGSDRQRSDRQSAWWTMDRGSWHCIGDRDQDYPHGKEMQKSKMAVWGSLTNSCEKKRSQKQRRKGKI